jgi:hypothetical protein
MILLLILEFFPSTSINEDCGFYRFIDLVTQKISRKEGETDLRDERRDMIMKKWRKSERKADGERQ